MNRRPTWSEWLQGEVRIDRAWLLFVVFFGLSLIHWMPAVLAGLFTLIWNGLVVARIVWWFQHRKAKRRAR